MKKVYKIRYTLNILPSMSEKVTTLMDALGETEELEVFDCKSVVDMIDFKWLQYSRKVHYMGLIAHMMYLGCFSLYIFELYIYKTGTLTEVIESFMILGIMYPMVYDLTQLKKQGIQLYFSDFWNYFDQIQIWGGFYNIYYQISLRSVHSDHDHVSADETLFDVSHGKAVMICVTFIMLIKTFYFLRLFNQFSGLVIMMKTVTLDLRAFMVFYFILIWICALVFNILELGNFISPRNEALKTKLKAINYPGIEYKMLPRFLR